MSRSLLFLILAIASAVPASGSDLDVVKCGANQDRVWVYNSLNSFDVEAKLSCGESVEIVSRVKGYVKIRTTTGMEGYVPDAAFPDLPALPPGDNDKPISSVAARPAVATVAHPVTPAAVPTAPPAPAPAASVTPVPPAPIAVKPIVTTASVAPKLATVTTNSAVVTSAAAPAVDAKPTPTVAVVAPPRQPAKTAASVQVAEPPPVKQAPVKAPVAVAKTTPTPANIPGKEPAPSITATTPAKAPIAPVGGQMMVTSVTTSTGRDSSIARPEASATDTEDYPDAKVENESADPACQVFFSAYGLAPAQYKWLVETRRKEYAAICPAPDLSRVDYVIIFAHDSDTFNYAMPAPVHTDRNGFSDFSPMSTVDTALQSASEVEKARYEFVWVFQTKRGTFDPSTFSARRRPQFTTDAKGSHVSPKAIEDAFQFIQGQGSSQVR